MNSPDHPQFQATDYEFSGIPLTPLVAAAIIFDIFSDNKARREDISKKVLEYHVENGGKKPKGNLASITKRALSLLARDGKASSTGVYGFWAFPKKKPLTVMSVSHPIPPVSIDNQKEQMEGGLISEETKKIGANEGTSGFVYLYYYPSYRILAELSGECFWPCKIGYTDAPCEYRIRDQMGTSTCENPIVALVIYTNDPRKIERAIHSILAASNKKISGIPGVEWFSTNPQTVEKIISLIEEVSTH